MISAPVRRRLANLVPPAALVALVAICARFAVDRAAGPARVFLALVVAGALAALAFAARPQVRWLPFASALFAPLVILLPVESPGTLAILWGLAALALAAVAGAGLSGIEPPRRRELFALAYAAQLLVHADLLWTAPTSPRTFLLLALAPAVAAAALEALARARSELVFGAALASFAAGPGWDPLGCAALIGVAIVIVRARPAIGPASALVAVAAAAPALDGEAAWIALALAAAAAVAGHPQRQLAGLGRAAVALAALGALLAGAPPWSRRAPLGALLVGVAAPPLGRVESQLRGRTATLHPRSPRLELALPGAPIASVVLDSFLIEAAELPCGTPLARVSVAGEGRELAVGVLRVGAESGEWAAGRADVAARIACGGFEPFARWIPRGERFFAALHRARFRLESPLGAERLIVERDPRLPPRTRIVIVAAGGER